MTKFWNVQLFDGSAELDKHWTGHADGYEGMKVTLLVTELFFVPVVMDQYLKSTWALDQIKGGRSMEMFKPARCGVMDIFSELFE